MGTQSLIYSFVARGPTVLAEYTAFSGNFSTIAVQCLQKLPPNNNKFTYTCDRHTFNYLVEEGYSKFPARYMFESWLHDCDCDIFILEYGKILPHSIWVHVISIVLIVGMLFN